jgi:hypothetical protein
VNDRERFGCTFDLQGPSQFLERVVDGVSGGTPLAPSLLALLSREVAFSRPLRRVDVVAATKAFDLLSGAFCGGLHMPTRLVGTNKVSVALGANPFASKWVILKALEVGLCRLNIFDVGQGGEDGQPHRRGVGVWGWRIRDAQIRKVVCRTTSGVSDRNGFLASVSKYLKGEGGREAGERTPGDGGECTGIWYWSKKSERLKAGGLGSG